MKLMEIIGTKRLDEIKETLEVSIAEQKQAQESIKEMQKVATANGENGWFLAPKKMDRRKQEIPVTCDQRRDQRRELDYDRRFSPTPERT